MLPKQTIELNGQLLNVPDTVEIWDGAYLRNPKAVQAYFARLAQHTRHGTQSVSDAITALHRPALGSDQAIADHAADVTRGVSGDEWPTAVVGQPPPVSHLPNLIRVTHTPTYGGIPAYKVSVSDLGDELQALVAFCRPGTNDITHMYVPARTLRDRNRILALADKGLDVTTGNADKLVEMFAAFAGANQHITPALVAERLGYYEVPAQISPDMPVDTQLRGPREAGWLLSDLFVGPQVVEVDNRSHTALQKAYRPNKGRFETHEEAAKAWRDFVSTNYLWLDGVQGALVRFTFGAAHLAPIMRVLGQYSMIVHFHGLKSKGKSSGAMLACSSFGDPRKGAITQTMNGTMIGTAEIFAHEVSDLPVLLDETMTNKALDSQEFVMTLTQGVERRRSRLVTAAPTQNRSYNTVIFTTGEHPLIGTDYGGQSKRVIEIQLTSTTALSDTLNRRVYDWINHEGVWGYCGRSYLQKLQRTMRTLEDRARYAVLRQEFSNILFDKFRDRGLSDMMGAVAVAEYLLLSLEFGVAPEEARERALKDMELVYTSCVRITREETDRPIHERFLETLRQDIFANPSHYADVGTDEGRERARHGVSATVPFTAFKHGTELIFFNEGFTRLCMEKLNLKHGTVLRELREHKILVGDAESGQYGVQRQVKSVLPAARYYVVNYLKVFSATEAPSLSGSTVTSPAVNLSSLPHGAQAVSDVDLDAVLDDLADMDVDYGEIDEIPCANSDDAWSDD